MKENIEKSVLKQLLRDLKQKFSKSNETTEKQKKKLKKMFDKYGNLS